MKKLMLIVLLISVFAKANEKLKVAVTIVPQATFVKKIGKDKVDVVLMVKRGFSPKRYEPKPSQMIELSKAKLYFMIKDNFEKAWISKFENQNKNLKLIDITKGIKRIKASFSKKKNALDHHVWTSPDMVKIIAGNIYKNLSKYDKKNESFYKKNYEEFLKEIEQTDKKIKNILKGLEGSKFLVFHPAWGYFAHQYGLKQLAMQKEGKTPMPKRMTKILKIAKKENIKAIFTSKEFSPQKADILAKELGIKVQRFSPLSPKWSKNLINVAKAIANN